MESYGLYFAAQNSYVKEPEVLCIKSVSDFCDELKNDDFQNACAYLSAQITKKIMINFEYERITSID